MIEPTANNPADDELLAARFEAVSRVFDLLSHLPVPEPPPDLVSRTLARAAAKSAGSHRKTMFPHDPDVAMQPQV
jgi:hypothetical protein